MKLYAAPNTRALRVVWLVEELGLTCDVELVEFQPTSDRFFIQHTPTGKIPTLEDGDMVMCESGAIVEYILERYAGGRLAPAAGSPARGPFLQWLHFAESSAFAPLGVVVWLTRYRDDASEHPELVSDAKARAARALAYVEEHLGLHTYLAGDGFSAADIMMGFTLLAAQSLNLLAGQPNLAAYLSRLQGRPALKRTLVRIGMA